MHAISPAVGGGSGATSGVDVEHVVVAASARDLGRPARWTETHAERMVAVDQGRARHDTVTTGGPGAQVWLGG